MHGSPGVRFFFFIPGTRLGTVKSGVTLAFWMGRWLVILALFIYFLQRGWFGYWKLYLDGDV